MSTSCARPLLLERGRCDEGEKEKKKTRTDYPTGKKKAGAVVERATPGRFKRESERGRERDGRQLREKSPSGVAQTDPSTTGLPIYLSKEDDESTERKSEREAKQSSQRQVYVQREEPKKTTGTERREGRRRKEGHSKRCTKQRLILDDCQLDLDRRNSTASEESSFPRGKTKNF